MARPYSLQLPSYRGCQPLNEKEHPSLSLLAVAVISGRGVNQDGTEHHIQSISFTLPPARVLRMDFDPEALQLEDELREVPLVYIRHKLKELGPVMLASTQAFASSPHHAGSDTSPSEGFPAPVPSQKLLISFEDSAQPLFLPVHGLVWALASPLLPSLATAASAEAPPFLLDLPSSSSFHLFHTWVYLQSTTALLDTLFSFNEREPSQPNASPELLADLCSAQEPETLLAKLELLSGLYRNAVALQVWDDELWAMMKGAWRALVDGLNDSLKRRRFEEVGETA